MEEQILRSAPGVSPRSTVKPSSKFVSSRIKSALLHDVAGWRSGQSIERTVIAVVGDATSSARRGYHRLWGSEWRQRSAEMIGDCQLQR